MNNKLLIVGIDPGTTTGYAVLDTDGNLLKTDSGKEIGLNTLVKDVSKLGRVVIVGTDKKKVPHTVISFSAKLGAKIINPNEDLKVSEKKEITKEFSSKINDGHQNDALAAALFALKKLKPLMKKIDFITKNSPMKDDIADIVIRKNISIYEAIKILQPEKKEEKEIIEKLVEDRELNEKDFNKIYEKLKKLHNENKILKKYNTSLKLKIGSLESRLSSQNKSSSFINSRIDRIFSFKENRLKNYEMAIMQKNRSMDFLRKDIKKLMGLLIGSREHYILKKIDTLGSSQFETRKMLLNIKQGDVLLVDNPNIVSDSTIKELEGKVDLIIHNKPVSRKLRAELPFIFIDGSRLDIQDLGIIAAVEKSALEEEKRKNKSMEGMIENYKKERMSMA